MRLLVNYFLAFIDKEKTIMKFGWTYENEILNGRLAMTAFVIMVGTYLTTGKLLPGVF